MLAKLNKPYSPSFQWPKQMNLTHSAELCRREIKSSLQGKSSALDLHRSRVLLQVLISVLFLQYRKGKRTTSYWCQPPCLILWTNWINRAPDHPISVTSITLLSRLTLPRQKKLVRRQRRCQKKVNMGWSWRMNRILPTAQSKRYLLTWLGQTQTKQKKLKTKMKSQKMWTANSLLKIWSKSRKSVTTSSSPSSAASSCNAFLILTLRDKAKWSQCS